MCHSKAFGTKGVGFGNAVVGEYETSTTRLSSPTSPSHRYLGTTPLRTHFKPTSPLSHDSFSGSVDRSGPSSPLSNPFGQLSFHDHPSQSPSPPKPRLSSDRRLLSDDDFDQPLSASSRPSSTKPTLSNLISRTTKASEANLPSLELAEPDHGHTSDQDDGFEAPIIPFPHIIIKSKPNPSFPSPSSPPPHSPLREESPSRPKWFPAPAPRHSLGSVIPLPTLTSSLEASLVRSQSIRTSKSSSTPSRWSVLNPVIKPSPSSGLDLGSHDGPKVCPRCLGTVYHAEQVLALGKKWHS